MKIETILDKILRIFTVISLVSRLIKHIFVTIYSMAISMTLAGKIVCGSSAVIVFVAPLVFIYSNLGNQAKEDTVVEVIGGDTETGTDDRVIKDDAGTTETKPVKKPAKSRGRFTERPIIEKGNTEIKRQDKSSLEHEIK